MKKIQRHRVGELPLIHSVINKLKLRELLHEFIPPEMNEKISAADTIILLIYNLVIGKEPLYELESWSRTLNLNLIGYEKYSQVRFTDDRFGKALDKLAAADRASLLINVVVGTIKTFKIETDQLHNDSTSVKAYGKYKGKTKTGFELKHGHSKDHRPDLKQLIYTLTISRDGAVPMHFKVYPGNRTDDTTHIETWQTVAKITGKKDFLYVADCKVCTDEQLSSIVGNGGKVITVVPKTWGEVNAFKDKLREGKETKKEILRRKKEGERTQYYYVYEGEHFTKHGYRIHWIVSADKKLEDLTTRENLLKKAEKELQILTIKIDKRNLKTKEQIQNACNEILSKNSVANFINVDITEIKEERTLQVGKGRPGKETKYKTVVKIRHVLTWSRDTEALEKEKHVDGVFPLLSTDAQISAKDALCAYKFQPRLEKRFSQFKSIHNAAPLFFKNVERIEANMFVFFLSLMIQAIIEREIRNAMEHHKLPHLRVYPENREALHPTTSKVFDLFGPLSTYSIIEDGNVVEQYRDELTEVHQEILKLLEIEEEHYWYGLTRQEVGC